jgi:gluconate 2-dehydrogenase alpha chain
VATETRRRYGASRLPKGTTVEDWPFGLEELEPYYEKVEFEIGVSGQAGNVKGVIDQRGNKFEGARARPYPMPPLRGTGFHRNDGGRGALARLASVPGTGRHHVRPLRRTGGLRVSRLLQSRRLPRELEGLDRRHDDPEGAAHETSDRRDRGARDVDRRGHAGSREWRLLSQGHRGVLPAGVGRAARRLHLRETSALLLLSTSAAFPKGLSNNHGQVGRHYFSHNQIATVNALFPRNLNTWYGLPAQGVAVDDWADDNFDHGGMDFIGGGNLWVYSDRRPIGAANMSTFGRAPRWGAQWKAFIKENADRGNTAYLQRTTLPYEDNYLDLDPERKDPLGFPVCRITADYKENERRLADFIQDKMIQWYRAAGAIATEKTGVGTMGPSTHAYGGTRMGDNPDTNVVNRWGLSHEVPNLGVLGASVMGTSGARNPTLTAQALAWRTAEYVARNWKAVAP